MCELVSSYKKYIFFAFYILIFIFFSWTATHLSPSPHIWGYDTNSYLRASITNPWESIRTPGYLFYLKLLQADVPMRRLHDSAKEGFPDENTIDKINLLIKDDAYLTSFFRNISIINCLLFSLGCSFLTYALSRFILRSPPDTYGIKSWLMRFMLFFLIWFSIDKGVLPPANFMYADYLVAILLLFNLSFILLYLSSYNNVSLLVSCAIAAYASLVKPGFYFLPLICGIICFIRILYDLYRRMFENTAKVLFIGVFLTVLTLAWPVYLYIKGGVFLPSQLSSLTNYAIAYFLTQPGDDDLDINSNSREIIKKINEQRAEVVDIVKLKKVKYPYSRLPELHQYYISTFDLVSWARRGKIWKELRLPGSYLAYAKQIDDFAPKIINKHKKEYLKLLLANFIAAFNQFPESRHAHAWWISDHYRLTFFIIGLALICGMRNFRIPIALFASAHILYMLFCSFGGYISNRYVSSTEFIVLLAFLLSILSLLLRIYRIGRTRYHGNLPLKRSLGSTSFDNAQRQAAI